MKIKFLLTQAQQELLDAVEFYEGQLEGLGALFHQEVTEAVEMIGLFPEGWQLITNEK